jgi:hypothetical protein
MPIIRTDAISGNIYVVAASADEAQRSATVFLGGDETDNVFSSRKGALEFQRDPFRPRVGEERLYVVSLDIRQDPGE